VSDSLLQQRFPGMTIFHLHDLRYLVPTWLSDRVRTSAPFLSAPSLAVSVQQLISLQHLRSVAAPPRRRPPRRDPPRRPSPRPTARMQTHTVAPTYLGIIHAPLAPASMFDSTPRPVSVVRVLGQLNCVSWDWVLMAVPRDHHDNYRRMVLEQRGAVLLELIGTGVLDSIAASTTAWYLVVDASDMNGVDVWLGPRTASAVLDGEVIGADDAAARFPPHWDQADESYIRFTSPTPEPDPRLDTPATDSFHAVNRVFSLWPLPTLDQPQYQTNVVEFVFPGPPAPRWGWGGVSSSPLLPCRTFQCLSHSLTVTSRVSTRVLVARWAIMLPCSVICKCFLPTPIPHISKWLQAICVL